MDKKKLLYCPETMDNALSDPATLCVYGSAAFILLLDNMANLETDWRWRKEGGV